MRRNSTPQNISANGEAPEAAPALDTPDFDDELSRRLWNDYLERIEAMLEPLRPTAREEIVQELKTHLLDSIRYDNAEQEAERVMNATEKLGRPEEYLEPIVTDRIIEEGATTYNPLWVLKGLGRTLTRGVKKTLLGLLFSVGYLISLSLIGMALLEPFIPHHVGLFYGAGKGIGGYMFGILDQTDGMTEILGIWVIPLGLASGLLIYGGLTQILGLLSQSD